MNTPVTVLRTIETVRKILHVLENMPHLHSGFPVIDEFDPVNVIISDYCKNYAISHLAFGWYLLIKNVSYFCWITIMAKVNDINIVSISASYLGMIHYLCLWEETQVFGILA